VPPPAFSVHAGPLCRNDSCPGGKRRTGPSQYNGIIVLCDFVGGQICPKIVVDEGTLVLIFIISYRKT
jgi:hypothetical protein